jgi:crotonobetainyl-CoA:carnitine CoA-transferase CaiB-like acyl-CoA transferase
MAERSARRQEVLAVVTKALATDTAEGWEARLKALGVPARSVRNLPAALADAADWLCTAGGLRLAGNAIKVEGYQPSYGAAPALGEHGDLVTRPAQARQP